MPLPWPLTPQQNPTTHRQIRAFIQSAIIFLHYNRTHLILTATLGRTELAEISTHFRSLYVVWDFSLRTLKIKCGQIGQFHGQRLFIRRPGQCHVGVSRNGVLSQVTRKKKKYVYVSYMAGKLKIEQRGVAHLCFDTHGFTIEPKDMSIWDFPSIEPWALLPSVMPGRSMYRYQHTEITPRTSFDTKPLVTLP